MPVPFEAFLPLAIVTGAFFFGGYAVEYTQRFGNNGKVLI